MMPKIPKPDREPSESIIQSAIRGRVGTLRDCRIWRNNTGQIKDARGVPVRFGLCVGSSDLIGIGPGGRFLALEVKRRGELPTDEQEMFIDVVRSCGGIAGVVYSVDDALQLIREARGDDK